MKIEQAIHQTAFESEYHKLHINLIYTASWLHDKVHEILKEYELSEEQFNVLRILRGSKVEKVSLKYIAERMINKQSNASRLVDKLLEKNWIDRVMCPLDRRQVDIKITDSGLEVLKVASLRISELNNFMKTKIAETEAETMNYYLDKIRS